MWRVPIPGKVICVSNCTDNLFPEIKLDSEVTINYLFFVSQKEEPPQAQVGMCILLCENILTSTFIIVNYGLPFYRNETPP